MSIAEHESTTPPPKKLTRPRTGRTPWKATMYWLRRLHLYFGLFLLPWAILYGVTAFLFNHPTAFSDANSTTFGADMLQGTPLESPTSPESMASEIVKELNNRSSTGASYSLAPHAEAAFTREFAFATVKTEEGSTFNVLVDVRGNGGTIREQAPRPEEKKTIERAPFAIGAGGAGGGGRGGRGGAPKGAAGGGPGRGAAGGEGGRPTAGLKLSEPLHERVATAVPLIMERHQLPAGEVTITSVPDLTFKMNDSSEKVWQVSYNALTGSVSGRLVEDEAKESISTRRFLLRLHTSHGYPSAGGIRWYWAVIVDAMAFIMVFWGLSGLMMWWQIKATRRIGILLLLLSGIVATLLAMGMHEMMNR
jgi:hypothetical protein